MSIVPSVVFLLLSMPAVAQVTFDDVPEDAYYARAVDWMLDEGLTTGSADGRFRPDDAVTRGETAVFLWRLAGQPDAPVHRFTDVTVGWQDDAIAWMADAGITQGSTPTTFDPDGTVSRGALAVFLWRLAGRPDAPPHAFDDVDDPALESAVSWIAASGISSGLAPAEFGPGVAVIRGQLAVFLQRLSETGLVARVEPGPEPEATSETVAEPVDVATAIAVEPSSPRVGERVTVVGSGFAPGGVMLTIGDEVADVFAADSNGGFRVEVVIPAVEAGNRIVAAVADGAVVASTEIEVRPQAPTSYLLPVAFLVAALAAVGSWWWRQRQTESDAEPDVETIPDVEAVPTKTTVAAETSDLFSVTPVAAGTLDTLAVFNGSLWASATVDFDDVDHAMVLTTLDRGREWAVVADLGPGHIDAISVSQRDAIAFGSRLVVEELGAMRKATMWHSNDLKSWMAIGLPGVAFSEASFDGVVGVGATLVAYGRNSSGPALWVGSERGWSSRPMPGPIDTVASTAHGAVLFGRNSEQRQGIALLSRDGADWQPNKHPSTALFGSATVLSVVDFQGGLVAAGYDNLRGTAAVWVSDDAIQWHRSPMEFPDDTGIEHLAVAEGAIVAVGTIRSATGSRKTSIGVWTSVDAVEWDLADDDGLGVDGRVNAVAFDGPSVVIAGARTLEAEAPPASAVWRFFGVGLPASAT